MDIKMNKRLRDFLKKSYYMIRKKPFIQQVEWNGKNYNFYITTLQSFHRGTGCVGAERQTIRWIDQLFDVDDVFYDVGANIGLFSLYAGKKGCKVFGFEPQFHNYYLFNKNIYYNNLGNVIAFPFSAHNKTEVNTLYSPTIDDGGAQATFMFKDKIKETIFSQGSIGISIDDLTKYLPFPNHIKIDVDGNEPFVLDGMKETLKRKELQSVLIEINKFIPDTKVKKIITQILHSGFGIYDISEESDNNHIFVRL